MQTIVIKTIPHNEQRYDTVGDYFNVPALRGSGCTRYFRVSDMGNPDYEFLVALHELIESHLVQKRGISDESIDAFDKQFEFERTEGLHADDAEPGDDERAPYHREHMFASAIERLVAHELGVQWDKYDEAVEGLYRTRRPEWFVEGIPRLRGQGVK